MNEWEAKYKALLMGIDNPAYIENAEKMVKVAMHLASTSPHRFDEVLFAMSHLISKQMFEDTPPASTYAQSLGHKRMKG